MKEKYLLVEIIAMVSQLVEGVLPQILRQNRSNMMAQTLLKLLVAPNLVWLLTKMEVYGHGVIQSMVS